MVRRAGGGRTAVAQSCPVALFAKSRRVAEVEGRAGQDRMGVPLAAAGCCWLDGSRSSVVALPSSSLLLKSSEAFRFSGSRRGLPRASKG